MNPTLANTRLRVHEPGMRQQKSKAEALQDLKVRVSVAFLEAPTGRL